MAKLSVYCAILVLLLSCSSYVPKVQSLRFGSVRPEAYLGVNGEGQNEPVYTPGEYFSIDENEEYYLNQADLSYLPNDFRIIPIYDPNRLAAWGGIVVDIHFNTVDENQMIVSVLVEHRYYDFSSFVGDRPYELSKFGEGNFTISWMVEDTKASRFSLDSTVGNMIIAYGNPRRIGESDAINMILKYIRLIPPNMFSSNVKEYGRKEIKEKFPSKEVETYSLGGSI